MNTRKLLLVLLAVCFVLAGVECALSIVPHTHGADTDHSQHTGCPIHQLEKMGFFADAVTVFSVLVLFAHSFLVPLPADLPRSERFFRSCSRAPPAIS